LCQACDLVLQFFSQRFNVVTGLLYRLGQATSYEFNKAACRLTPDLIALRSATY